MYWDASFPVNPCPTPGGGRWRVRSGRRFSRSRPEWYRAFLAGTALVMTAQGYLGGEMVYRFGANVCGGSRGLNEKRQDSSPPWPPGRPRKI